VPASAAAGTYELRLFAADGFTLRATSGPIAVVADASVSGTPTPITAGGTLTASWSNIGAPTATDWIALARVGSATTSYVTWRYTTGTASGSGPLVVPASAAAGTYELRLFAADGFTLRATSTSIVLN
jgi:5-hydroxyisourate hydrolase-like protein (transthyretin family)